MEPSSCKMTSGDPLLAHDIAQSALMGFFSPLVKAHAESSTQPVTVFWSAAKPDALMTIPRTVAIANGCFMGPNSIRNVGRGAIAGINYGENRDRILNSLGPASAPARR